MRKSSTIGIDPGASGGIAVKEGDAPPYVWALDKTSSDIVEEFRAIAYRAAAEGRQCVAIMEELVKFIPGKFQSSSTSITYGESYGFLRGVLAGLGIRTERVRSQTWQKDLGLASSRGMERREAKRRLKQLAQELYPALNKEITLKTADALLILEWAMRREKA